MRSLTQVDRNRTYFTERRHVFMATATKLWTIEELHRLPDDGNKYELVRGALFVTPAPGVPHEEIAVRLTHLIYAYVVTNRLGYVYHPRSSIMFEGSEVEPDLMVRQPHPDRDDPTWENAPTPSLVVEIVSRITARRDRHEKRTLYMDAGIPEYWIVDRFAKTITIVQPRLTDVVVHDRMLWQPYGISTPLLFNLSEVFEPTG